MANPNPKPNYGNIGGNGRTLADMQKLKDLAFGKLTLKDVQPKQIEIEQYYYKDEPIEKKVKGKIKIVGYKQVKLKRKVLVEVFENAWQNICYNALTNKGAFKSILDKLYADQRNVVVEDNTPPTREKLKTLANDELYKIRKQLTEELGERAGS